MLAYDLWSGAFFRFFICWVNYSDIESDSCCFGVKIDFLELMADEIRDCLYWVGIGALLDYSIISSAKDIPSSS